VISPGSFTTPDLRAELASRGGGPLGVIDVKEVVIGAVDLAMARRLWQQIERIKPGHPQQNGRHERMHLTLKREATKPAAGNVLQQQARFDDFVTRYNTDRPHQALGMKVPADRPSW
jgi:hypothetical protein